MARRNPNKDFIPIYQDALGKDRIRWLEEAAENDGSDMGSVITSIIKSVIDDECAHAGR